MPKSPYLFVLVYVSAAMLFYTSVKSFCVPNPEYRNDVAAQAAVGRLCFEEFTALLDQPTRLRLQNELHRLRESDRRAKFIDMLKTNRGYFQAAALRFDYVAPCMERFMSNDYESGRR